MRQNHQGFSTEFRDGIQKLGPMRAEVPSDGDVTAAAKERSFQDELKASCHSIGNEGLAIFIFILFFFLNHRLTAFIAALLGHIPESSSEINENQAEY